MSNTEIVNYYLKVDFNTNTYTYWFDKNFTKVLNGPLIVPSGELVNITVHLMTQNAVISGWVASKGTPPDYFKLEGQTQSSITISNQNRNNTSESVVHSFYVTVESLEGATLHCDPEVEDEGTHYLTKDNTEA